MSGIKKIMKRLILFSLVTIAASLVSLSNTNKLAPVTLTSSKPDIQISDNKPTKPVTHPSKPAPTPTYKASSATVTPAVPAPKPVVKSTIPAKPVTSTSHNTSGTCVGNTGNDVCEFNPNGALDKDAPVTSTNKCYENCTDPNRPQYDLWGNEWSATGTLLKIGSCEPDPISGKPNPYCEATNG
jgi:hypothetical protein